MDRSGAKFGVFSVFRARGLISVKPVIERSLPENVAEFYEVQTTSRLYYAGKVIETEELIRRVLKNDTLSL